MLQQTQVPRVVEKFPEFIKAFPDFGSLARSPLKKVLKVWQGMGYNRRAVMLQKTASIIKDNYKSILPKTIEGLSALPGIGKATASSILAFAFSMPTIFIETNIRTAFIHEFFTTVDNISDADILPLVERALYRPDPRLWYNALMDYGVMLKTRFPNPGRRSRHYTRQSRFEGSNRQVRGKVIKLLINEPMSPYRVAKELELPKEKISVVLEQLRKEGFVTRKGKLLQIK